MWAVDRKYTILLSFHEVATKLPHCIQSKWPVVAVVPRLLSSPVPVDNRAYWLTVPQV
ncbi:hypothetical protein DPMN_068270 [Dreissena polymorpha]|uniref:Uncharacterized protein n=1 Tax=Dreissena polymorpha TaxID=45954 RepID=A0A9D4BM23_DREPO|nr:hypothetical protein DPMN_068270 [Dreissena polymorpha]